MKKQLGGEKICPLPPSKIGLIGLIIHFEQPAKFETNQTKDPRGITPG